jgi:hypothetical protein
MFLVIKFILAIILTEAITEIITKSGIFLPLRAKVFSLGQENIFFKWLHNLLDCGYCFSMWSGMFVAILFFKGIDLLHWSLDWFFVAIVLHRLSNLFHNIMDRVHGFEKYGKG